jgi:ABC-type amino acid transport substrate-binding protein
MRLGKHTVAAVATVIAGTLALAACGSAGSSSGTAQVKTTTAVLNAVTSGSEQPFAFTSPTGKAEGFSIDLVNKIAAALGMKVQYKVASLDNILSGLTDHQYDICACALQVTPARKKTLAFSESYYYASLGIVAVKSAHLTTAAGLAGKTLAVQTDSAEEQYAQQNYPKAELKDYPDQATALTALKAGLVDAFLVGEPSVPGYLAQDPQLESIATIQLTAANSFPIAFGDTSLAAKVNAQLDILFADGYYSSDYHKWFGKNVAIPALLIKQHPSFK